MLTQLTLSRKILLFIHYYTNWEVTVTCAMPSCVCVCHLQENKDVSCLKHECITCKCVFLTWLWTITRFHWSLPSHCSRLSVEINTRNVRENSDTAHLSSFNGRQFGKTTVPHVSTTVIGQNTRLKIRQCEIVSRLTQIRLKGTASAYVNAAVTVRKYAEVVAILEVAFHQDAEVVFCLGL